MPVDWVSVVISVVGFAATILTLAVGGSWKLRGELGMLRQSFTENLNSLQASFTRDLNSHQTSDDEQFAVIRREVGETVTAIRHGLTEVEKTAAARINAIEVGHRDLFIRRDSFMEVVRGMKEQHEGMRSDLRDLVQRTDQHLAALGSRPITITMAPAPSKKSDPS